MECDKVFDDIKPIEKKEPAFSEESIDKLAKIASLIEYLKKDDIVNYSELINEIKIEEKKNRLQG